MENIFDLGKVAYVAAKPPQSSTTKDILKLFIETLVDVMKVLILSIPHWIEALIFLFISRPKKSVSGKIALVTGAGNGIGKQIALRLAREGCHIAVADIEEEAAIRTVEEIKKMNVKSVAYHLDISDYAGALKVSAQIKKDLGPVDILVNNAAILPLLSFREGSVEEVQRIVNVNVTANFIMTRIFLPSMMARRNGHIVNISSLAAFHAVPGAIIYSSTKFALLGFAEGLSEELRQDGFGDCVHVTSVHPFFVATRQDLVDALHLSRFPAMTPKRTADVAVDGMLRNQLHVCIPSIDRWLTLVLQLLPYKVQHLIRDHVLREQQCRNYMMKMANNK